MEIHNRYAFMKSFDRSNISNSKASNLGLFRQSSFKIRSPSHDDIHDYYYISPNKHETKEISYFDWSKVRLHGQRYKDHENESTFELVSNKKADPIKSPSYSELPQILTIRF
jgi:hypothetical protein